MAFIVANAGATEAAQDAVGTALVDSTSIDFTYNDGTNTISAVVLPAGVDHGGLAGLADDDHTQYALLAGRSGGQTQTGGTAASNNLVLRSTTNATKGQVYLDETTDSSSITTGAARIDGGLGVAKNVYVGTGLEVGNTALGASAIFQVDSTTKGALLPRMTRAQRNAIASPAEGLEIYNTNSKMKEFYNGLYWGPSSMTSGPYWVEWFDDFFGQLGSTAPFIGDWYQGLSGAGASETLIDDTTGYGIFQLSTGTTNSGIANFYQANYYSAGLGLLTYRTRVRFPTLSVAAQEYSLTIGLDGGVHGIHFVYDRLNYGNFWSIWTYQNSSFTITTTSSAIAANTWYDLQAVVNAAGTSVTFYVNGTSVGTHTTNIPTGTSHIGPYNYFTKSAGTQARTAHIDYWYLLSEFTTARG